MEIKVRKIKKKDIKIITEIMKKIGIDSFNIDLKDKKNAGTNIIKTIIDKYILIDDDLTLIISELTDLTKDQIEELDIDELISVLKDIWKVNDVISFLG